MIPLLPNPSMSSRCTLQQNTDFRMEPSRPLFSVPSLPLWLPLGPLSFCLLCVRLACYFSKFPVRSCPRTFALAFASTWNPQWLSTSQSVYFSYQGIIIWINVCLLVDFPLPSQNVNSVWKESHSPPTPHCLREYLVHRRCSVRPSWMNERMNEWGRWKSSQNWLRNLKYYFF